jgi:single-stranded-DNA-specific exonuclease
MHWHSKPLPEADKIKALQLAIGVSFEIASLLVQRGIDDFESAKNFFRPELKDLQ